MDFEAILAQIARDHHTTPQQVYREMQAAIDAACESPDPEARARLRRIPCAGRRPTPEEFVLQITLALGGQGETGPDGE